MEETLGGLYEIKDYCEKIDCIDLVEISDFFLKVSKNKYRFFISMRM